MATSPQRRGCVWVRAGVTDAKRDDHGSYENPRSSSTAWSRATCGPVLSKSTSHSSGRKTERSAKAHSVAHISPGGDNPYCVEKDQASPSWTNQLPEGLLTPVKLAQGRAHLAPVRAARDKERQRTTDNARDVARRLKGVLNRGKADTGREREDNECKIELERQDFELIQRQPRYRLRGSTPDYVNVRPK